MLMVTFMVVVSVRVMVRVVVPIDGFLRVRGRVMIIGYSQGSVQG